MDAADRELLAGSVSAALDSSASPAANDEAIVALGWADMLEAEPVDAVSVVFGELGRTAARSSLLDDVVGAALGLAPGAAVVHPGWGDALPAARGAEDHIQIEGTAGSRVRGADVVHIVLADGVATVAADALSTAVRDSDTQDDGDLATVVVDGPAIDWLPHDPDAIEQAVTAARRALGHQLHGLSAGMLALARQHAADRVQFGKPIGSFQAVRHKLAETHVAIEAAGEALAVADEGPSLTVDLARVIAGRAALDAGRHCQQVLAGIGFTRDHDFHRFLFTAIEIDGLYGTTPHLTKSLGRRLLADRDVPRVVDL